MELVNVGVVPVHLESHIFAKKVGEIKTHIASASEVMERILLNLQILLTFAHFLSLKLALA